MEYWDKILAIISGLCTAIPLVVALIRTVSVCVKEKNWNKIVSLTLHYMEAAQEKIQDGATKKEWVLAMVRESAKSIDYNLDDAAVEKLSELIDSVCDTSKKLSAAKDAADAGDEVAAA